MAEHASDGAEAVLSEAELPREEPVSPAPEPLRPVRVRYSLPLTESLSLEEARLALVNFLFAKKHQGRFVLRVDRIPSGGEAAPSPGLYDDLRWLGISWNEGPDQGGPLGPYRSAERLAVYEEHLQKLLDQGKAYPCYCSAEKLEEERIRFLSQGKTPRYSGVCRELSAEARNELESQGASKAIRIKVDRQILKFQDLVYGEKSLDSELLGDWVLKTADGRFVVDFTVAVDDALMKITHVIRGEKDLQGTFRQLLVFQALQHEALSYSHLPLLLGADHTLLSAKHGPATISELRNQGYFPANVACYLASVGGGVPGSAEGMNFEEIVRHFDWRRASKVSPVFDWEKLKLWNGRQLREIDETEFLALAREKVAGYAGALETKGKEWAEKTLTELRKQARTFQEIDADLNLLARPLDALEEDAQKTLKTKDASRVLKEAAQALESFEGGDEEASARLLEGLKAKIKSKSKNPLNPLKAALTGRLTGPELPLTLRLLGKEESIKRIEHALKNLQHAQPEQGSV